MSLRRFLPPQGRLGPVALILTVLGLGLALTAWKLSTLAASAAAAANQPEPMEAVTAVAAQPREHRAATTAIGTVLAMRSVTLRNELAGTVRRVALTPGRIVEPGTVLVALDVSVEQAELAAQQAQLALAQATLDRLMPLLARRAVSAEEVDRARAERDVARAEIARVQAIIERKTIRAPFRARVGLADVHPGQYLSEGTVLTTLQGVDEAAHVDFTVPEGVAARLRVGDTVQVAANGDRPSRARIVAIDARVNPATRSALVRARVGGALADAAPGASVRVRVPVGEATEAVSVPVSALRKGPGGDHVFVIEPDDQGAERAHLRAVEPGPVVDDQVLIVAGLRAGERVAASGSFKLREGVLVAPAAPTAALGNGGR